MKAIKQNKEYTITELEKQRYIDEGYDIVGDDGKLVAYGKGKTVPYEDYMVVVNELEALKASKARKKQEPKENQE
ncbi:MAG: hypothetical protein Q4F05_11260 [bacterium]|nr:hypothetical protein [bacterium]